MKFCTQCGSQVADNAAFCSNCGSKLGAPAQASAPQPTPQPAPQPAPQPIPQPQAGTYVNAPMNPNAAYGANGAYGAYGAARPVGPQLATNRSLLKFILLSMITCGIYAIVVMTVISTDINTIASPYDGKKTMHYCLLIFVIAPITCGIASIVWIHKLSNRIGDELQRRGIDYSFGAGTFWGWGVLGSLIIVGPFIFYHKLLKSMNLLAENYNQRG